jgi:serine/threonine protein kinase
MNLVNKIFSHYQIIKKLGSGGMGDVYKAEDMKLQRTVALKFFPSDLTCDEDAKKRFRKEAIAASALDHQNIGTIYEIVEQEDCFFIAMSYYNGGTLKDKIESHKDGMDVNEALDITLQIAEGLGRAHSKGIVHRDIKPANVLVTDEGQVKVIDFGLAKLKGSSIVTKSGTTLGTVAYMSPEQIECGSVDHRTDIWSLGVILYEMLAGQKPFQGEYEHGVMYKILNDEPKFITKVKKSMPQQIERIIEKALAKDPNKRFSSMKEMLKALKTTVEELKEGLHEKPPLFKLTKKQRRNAFRISAVAVVAILAVILFWQNKVRASAPVSIALLPLQSLTNDAEQEWFTDGMTDALITDLAKISGLRIISRASAMAYKGTSKTPPEIAAELGVQYVIEGSIVKMQDQVRISTRLINAIKDEYLWADDYQRDFSNILGLQGEIAQTIASKIKVRLTPSEETRLTSVRTIDPDIYELYLKGMYHLNKFTPEGLVKGMDYLHQAVKENPEEPFVYAVLALGYSTLLHTVTSLMEDDLTPTRTALHKALELDENMPEAHLAMAMIKIYHDSDWKAAESDYKRALELNPSLALGHAHYAWAILIDKDEEKALEEMYLAQKLDPLVPMYPAWEGWMYYWLERYDEAIEEALKSTELVPDFPIGLYVLGCAYAAKGMYEEAIEVHKKAGVISPAFVWGLGQTYALAGQREKALEVATQLESQNNLWNYFGLAEIYTALGDKDKAFYWLEMSYEHHHPYIQWLWRDCSFKSLHDDPRFLDLSRRLNLDDVSSKS